MSHIYSLSTNSSHGADLISPDPSLYFNNVPSAEYELVLASLQPHEEHHLLEITFDSELVSPEFGQDPIYHFEGVCPSQLF